MNGKIHTELDKLRGTLNNLKDVLAFSRLEEWERGVVLDAYRTLADLVDEQEVTNVTHCP